MALSFSGMSVECTHCVSADGKNQFNILFSITYAWFARQSLEAPTQTAHSC